MPTVHGSPNADEINAGLSAAVQHHKSRHFAEAAVEYREVLRICPDHPDALLLLGIVYRQMGKAREAANSIRESLSVRPDNAVATNELGLALTHLGDFEAAIEALRSTIRIAPDYAKAHNNLGNVLMILGQLEPAMKEYKKAIVIAPTYADAFNNLAMALMDQGRFDEAVSAFVTALDIQPLHSTARSNLLLCLDYDPDCDEASSYAAHLDWDVNHGAGRSSEVVPHEIDRAPDRLLRVGYVSPNLYRHSVGFCVAPVLAHHDPHVVSVICYSASAKEDDFTDRFKDSVQDWRSTIGVSDDALASMIRSDEIDILVDLAGHTQGNRLAVFAKKPAPVQVSWLGYWHTTGLVAMDYVLSDRVTIPARARKWFVETIVDLPDGRLCYLPPDDAPIESPPPSHERGVLTFGSFNNLTKVNPRVIAVWSQVLHAVDDSRLILKWASLADAETRKRFLDLFADNGIESGRVEMRPHVPHAQMLKEYSDVDIALDPFPFSGAITSLEALWMGVPVVTLAGTRPVSRQTTSLLTTLGLPELIADNEEEYIAIAVSVAKDLDRLDHLRVGMRRRIASSPLCDGKQFSRHLEDAYRKMWRKWCHSRADRNKIPS